MSRVKKYNSTTSEWEYADGPAGQNFIKSETTGNLTVSDTQPSSPLESDVWIEPGGKIGTSDIYDGAVTAPKIDFTTFSKRRNNGADGSAQNMHVAGWAGAMATASSAITINVTFGVTFTEPPIVTAVYGGDKASGAVSWPVGVAVKRGYVAAHTITTTGFTVTIYSSDGSNWSTANSVYAQWSAFGSVV